MATFTASAADAAYDSSIMFNDLPDGCVAQVVQQLQSVKDVLNFQRTCTRIAAIGKAHQAAWLNLIQKDYNITLQVCRVAESLFSVDMSRVSWEGDHLQVTDATRLFAGGSSV